MKEVKNQENQLPLLAQTGDICRKPYTDKNSEANVWRKFSMEELGKKLEHDLLQIPTFKAPYTTTSSPARLLSCEVVSVANSDASQRKIQEQRPLSSKPFIIYTAIPNFTQL